ncbi:MAG: hypothetical protein GC178_14350 [Flavobacteriales bacterium]|nr:hypothetical protein [Flavobacteriales bacterium]
MKKLLFVYLLASLVVVMSGFGSWSVQANSQSSAQPSFVIESSQSLVSDVAQHGNETVVRPFGTSFGLQNAVFVCELAEEEEDEDEKTSSSFKEINGLAFYELEVESGHFINGPCSFQPVKQHITSASTRGLYVLFEVFRI